MNLVRNNESEKARPNQLPGQEPISVVNDAPFVADYATRDFSSEAQHGRGLNTGVAYIFQNAPTVYAGIVHWDWTKSPVFRIPEGYRAKSFPMLHPVSQISLEFSLAVR